MKKIIAVLLCIALLSGSVAITAFAADTLKVIVANDLHLSSLAYTPYLKNNADSDWSHVFSSGQLIQESNAIITAFLDKAAASDAEAILVPGDITNEGTAAEHAIMVEKFRAFEQNTGKSVYVVAGNHDFMKTSVKEFKEFYSEFGYDEAIAVADDSASYVADIGKDYRLLAIDSIIPGNGTGEITQEDIVWVSNQLDKANADGKKVIAMMHHNLIEHYIFGEKIHKGGIVHSVEFRELLATKGVKFIFTGHTHDQDIASYTAADGSVIYDVVTNTLNAYPCTYREVTFGENVKFEAKTVDKVDLSLIPDGLSDEAMSLLSSDFREYSKKVIWTGLRGTFGSFLNASSLIKLIGIDAQSDPDMYRIITSLGDKLAEVVQMPFYNAADGGQSLSDVAAVYGKTLPKSNYTDLIDLAITLYQAHCVGDEYYPANSTEVQLLVSAIATVLCYCLEDVSAEDYTTVLNFVFTLTGIEISGDIVNFAGSSIKRIEGIDLIASTVLRPFVVQFTTDDAPADNNVTLAGYRELSGFEKFIQLFMEFFEKVKEFFVMIFSFNPFA